MRFIIKKMFNPKTKNLNIGVLTVKKGGNIGLGI